MYQVSYCVARLVTSVTVNVSSKIWLYHASVCCAIAAALSVYFLVSEYTLN